MINVYTAPETLPSNDEFAVFLAGGITGCDQWQGQVIKLFEDHFSDREINLINPRRKHFPADRPGESHKQIEWEYQAISNSSLVLFWFASGTLNPIVLFEYGKELGRDQAPLVVGCDPNYERSFDVKKQTELHNKDTSTNKVHYIHDDLGGMVREVVEFYDESHKDVMKDII